MHSIPLLCVHLDYADDLAATVYWDLGGDVTQYGSPEAIGKLVVLQFKVFASLHDGHQVGANASTGSARRPSHLGSRRYVTVSAESFPCPDLAPSLETYLGRFYSSIMPQSSLVFPKREILTPNS